MIPEDIIPNTGKLQAFIKDEALNSIFNVMHIILLLSLNREFDYSKPSLISLFFFQDAFPCTAENFFNLLLSDNSNFTNEYRSARKDTNLVVSIFCVPSSASNYYMTTLCIINMCKG